MKHCDAHTGYRYVDYGTEFRQCHQHVGLRRISDLHGITRYACSAPGHLANVVRRFGTAPDEISRDAAVAR